MTTNAAIAPLIDVAETSESSEEKLRRYELTLKAIAQCSLTGSDFGDWVQSVVEDVLSGLFPECWNCGTYVHDGACAGEDSES